MGVSINLSKDDKVLTIKISGRFDFSMHNDFRNAYKDNNLSNGVYVIDLKDTEYMDSSALGMLLLLKEYSSTNSSKIKIVHASAEIREILDIASFDKLFLID
ncbi:MAG: STAS domain-containing protein [Gammaproteobacteria bacterium]|nr:STAS domain-containing protein [Gammaproteobacteria bacterium]